MGQVQAGGSAGEVKQSSLRGDGDRGLVVTEWNHRIIKSLGLEQVILEVLSNHHPTTNVTSMGLGSRQEPPKGFGFQAGTPRRLFQISSFSPEVLVCNSTWDFTPISGKKLFSTSNLRLNSSAHTPAPHTKWHTAPLSYPSPSHSACKSLAHTLSHASCSPSSTTYPA